MLPKFKIIRWTFENISKIKKSMCYALIKSNGPTTNVDVSINDDNVGSDSSNEIASLNSGRNDVQEPEHCIKVINYLCSYL